MKTATLSLSTRLGSLPHATAQVNTSLALDKQKKQARIAISLKHSSEQLGFLHACLVRIGKTYFALTGPSGVGKSTVAEHIISQFGGAIVANDWIAVAYEEGNYYASDVNVQSELKHKNRIKLSGVIFLSWRDRYLRDAYTPTDQDLRRQLLQLFDDMPEKSSIKLTKFWQKNISNLSFYACVPTRDAAIGHTLQVVSLLVQRIITPKTSHIVGVVGLGNVGSKLAADLGSLPQVHKVVLYNRSSATARGLALDLNHARHKNGTMQYTAEKSLSNLFKTCDQVFITVGKRASGRKLLGVPERWVNTLANSSLIARYARIATEVGFKGTIFMVTNPVDYLVYQFYTAARQQNVGFCTFQVYGIGLELDHMRAMHYISQNRSSVSPDDVELAGNHSGELIYKLPLRGKPKDQLIAKVANASPEVRKYVPRTIYGPVAAAIRSYESFTVGGSCHITAIRKKAYIGERVVFNSLGLAKSTSSLHNKEYAQRLEENRKNVSLLAQLRLRRKIS